MDLRSRVQDRRSKKTTSALATPITAAEVTEAAHLCAAVYQEHPYMAGWRAISTRDLGLPDSYARQLFFVNRNAVAFVREQMVDGQRTLAVVFKGTAMGSLADWRDNIFGINRHYELMRPLIEALDAYVAANGITRVIASGHSLGGAMAELFIREHPDTAKVRFVGCTFGSPGCQVPVDYVDRRTLEIIHDDDLVPIAGGSVLTRYQTPGRTARMVRAGMETAWAGITGHRMTAYVDSVCTLGADGMLDRVVSGKEDIVVEMATGAMLADHDGPASRRARSRVRPSERHEVLAAPAI